MLALDLDSIAEVLLPSPKSLWLALIWPTLCLKIIFSWCKHVLFLFFCWFFFFSRLLYRFFTRIMTYFPMAGERDSASAARCSWASERGRCQSITQKWELISTWLPSDLIDIPLLAYRCAPRSDCRGLGTEEQRHVMIYEGRKWSIESSEWFISLFFL